MLRFWAQTWHRRGGEMGLANALDAESNRRTRKLCQMGVLLETMTNEDREAFEHAKQQIELQRTQTPVNNQWSTMTCASVWRALKSEGHMISKNSVQKHITDTCICQPQ